MPNKTTTKLPAKPSHALLADMFAAAPMIREVARSEHRAAQENLKPGSYYNSEERFAAEMRDYANTLVSLSTKFERVLKTYGKEITS